MGLGRIRPARTIADTTACDIRYILTVECSLAGPVAVRYGEGVMIDLQAILFVAVAALAAVAYFLWKRTVDLNEVVRTERSTAEERKADAEKARASARDKASSLDDVKKQLQDARAKLKRQQKASGGGNGKKSRTSGPAVKAEIDTGDSNAAVVRVSNKEVEAEAQKRVSALRTELQAAEAKIAKLEAEDQKRSAKQEAEKAAQAARVAAKVRAEKAALQASEAKSEAAAEREPKVEETPEQRIVVLETRLGAMRQAAKERERALEKQLNRLDAKERASTRRGNNNHALYQVIKGQLELAEERVALLNRKYEGAKKPEVFTPPKPKAAAPVAKPEAAAPVADAETATPAAEAEIAAPAATEVAEVQTEAPAEVQTEAPAVEAEAPAVEAEAPAVEAEVPAAEAEAPAEAKSDDEAPAKA